MRKKIIASILIIIFLIIILIYNPSDSGDKVCFNENCFEVEIADTPELRDKGLMNRDSLDKDKGMLFVFPKQDIYAFWMKDTLIPLDIIWLNSNKEVVSMSKNSLPCSSSCPKINPRNKAKYVLEINAGMSDEINLSMGDKLEF